MGRESFATVWLVICANNEIGLEATVHTDSKYALVMEEIVPLNFINGQTRNPSAFRGFEQRWQRSPRKHGEEGYQGRVSILEASKSVQMS